MSKGQYAQIETAFILSDPRLDKMTPHDFKLYICMWAFAVNQRSEYIIATDSQHLCRTLAHICRIDVRIVHKCVTRLLHLCLIECPTDSTIRVCGVINKHPKLKWKEVTLKNLEETQTTPNRIEENRIEENRILEVPQVEKVSRETIPYKEIIEYLNEKTGRNFKHETKSFKDKIKARWKEHPDIEDFKKVIDNKCADPFFQENKKYLNPGTLFGTKFDVYLCEEITDYNKEEDLEAEYNRIFGKDNTAKV